MDMSWLETKKALLQLNFIDFIYTSYRLRQKRQVLTWNWQGASSMKLFGLRESQKIFTFLKRSWSLNIVVNSFVLQVVQLLRAKQLVHISISLKDQCTSSHWILVGDPSFVPYIQAKSTRVDHRLAFYTDASFYAVFSYILFTSHNCMATADRAVVAFVKDFNGIRHPDHYKTA